MLDINTPCPREYISFRTSYNPAVGSRHGCILYVRRDVSHIPITLNSPLQAVAVQVKAKKLYTVCSLYLPPDDIIRNEDVVDLIQQLPKPYIILGDFNSRHPLWGDTVCNQKGNLISSLIENEDIGFLNTGEPTHYHIQTGTLSCIDLSLCSLDCQMDFSWRVIDDLHSSDHYPIIVTLADSSPEQRQSRWCLEKANWNTFKEKSLITCSADEFSSVDEAVDFFNNQIYSAGIHSIPRSSGLFKRRPVPWWSEELRCLHRATRTALTRLRRHRNEANLIEYKRCRASFRRTMKAARKKSWANFISTINSRTPLSLVWKKMRKIAGKYVPNPPPVLKVNGTLITDSKEVGNSFATHFAEVSRKKENSPGYNSRVQTERLALNFNADRPYSYNLPFTEAEFDSALSNCSDSTPGPDEIPYEMMRHISKETKFFIIGLINRIWRESNFPSVWEMATMLPFCKPGKDKFQAGSYRPIALTSCMCKLMEKMVNVRLVWYLERNNCISLAQCGFRQMHSTVDVLIRLESSICEAFATKQHHISVFFDIEKAYDTAWRYGIIKRIHEIGLRGELPLFIKAFLKNRLFRVRIGNILSEEMTQEEGVPQGSVLSVTLFALAINGISEVIPPGILYTLFVDDLSISFAATRMAVAERKLQLTIDKILNWADKVGFKFSFSKTKVVHFCRIRGLHPDPDLYMYGQRISCVEQTRFLGLTFDHRLTWEPHIRALKVKCLQASQILKILAHSYWGSDRNTLLIIYKALILSKLSYGCEVYSSASPRHLAMLDAIHHGGIRLATGAFKSSPIMSLLVDSGEMSLESHRQSMIMRYWYRLQRLPASLACKTAKSVAYFYFYDNHPRYPKPFGYRAKSLLTDFNLPLGTVSSFRLSASPPWVMPVVRFCRYFKGIKRDMSDNEIRSIFLEHASEHNESCTVYTDGSKSDDGVGYGVYSNYFNSQRGALPTSASNFTAELFSILTAIKKISSIGGENFTVFSDSRGALQALECFNSTQPIVLEILEWLHLQQCRGKNIAFCWVPAHVDIIGNEEADILAKNAAKDLIPGRYPLPCRDFFPGIRKSLQHSWQLKWDSTVCNKMKEIATTIKPWKYTNMSRRQTVILCRLRIGHTRITHGFLMAGDPQTYCQDCLVPLTVKHLLVECPSLGDLRNRFLSGGRSADGSYQLVKILGEGADFSDDSGVFRFLSEAGFLCQI